MLTDQAVVHFLTFAPMVDKMRLEDVLFTGVIGQLSNLTRFNTPAFSYDVVSRIWVDLNEMEMLSCVEYIFWRAEKFSSNFGGIFIFGSFTVCWAAINVGFFLGSNDNVFIGVIYQMKAENLAYTVGYFILC
jgi:hypothetical protein